MIFYITLFSDCFQHLPSESHRHPQSACLVAMNGVGSPTHCEKLPIPTAKPGEAAAMLSGQTQGTVIVSRLVTAGTDPGRGQGTAWLPLLWLFLPGFPSHIPAPHPSSPAAQACSQWHQLYPVYGDKPHPAILRRGMTPGATGSCPGSGGEHPVGVGRGPCIPTGSLAGRRSWMWLRNTVPTRSAHTGGSTLLLPTGDLGTWPPGLAPCKRMLF